MADDAGGRVPPPSAGSTHLPDLSAEIWPAGRRSLRRLLEDYPDLEAVHRV